MLLLQMNILFLILLSFFSFISSEENPKSGLRVSIPLNDFVCVCVYMCVCVCVCVAGIGGRGGRKANRQAFASSIYVKMVGFPWGFACEHMHIQACLGIHYTTVVCFNFA